MEAALCSIQLESFAYFLLLLVLRLLVSFLKGQAYANRWKNADENKLQRA